MKKGIIVLLAAVLAAGGGTAGYYYWQKGEAKENGGRVSSDSEDAVYVDSVKMLAGLGSGNGLIQRYGGVVESQETWEVKLENERSVKECYVKVGDEVKEGQKLFLYDTTDDEDKLAQAEIDLERCENDIESSTARVAQLEKEKKSASAEEQLNYSIQINQEQNTIKTSEYDYKSKQLEITQLKERIADAAVKSELDGVVKSIQDPNSSDSYMSDSSSSAYITVMQVGAYRIKGLANEQNINQITEGMDMIIHSRVDDSLTWRGMISEIKRDQGESNTESSSYSFYSSSDNGNSSTNYPYYVELDSSDGLMMGQHVYMEPDMGQEDVKDGIWLEDYYFVIAEDGSAYTWAASSSNLLEKRSVVLGEYDQDLAKYQVVEGLDEEDYIIVPDESLEEGLPVIYNDYASADSFSSDDWEWETDYDMNMGEEIGLDGSFEEDADSYMAESEDGIFYEDFSFDMDDSEEIIEEDVEELEGLE